MNSDPQDVAESLDEDVVDTVDDRSGDEFGEGLPDYPPDRPLGVNTVGVTAAEQDGGESLAERTAREEPDPVVDELDRTARDDAADADGPDAGAIQLVDAHATVEDVEAQLLADAEPAGELSAEEAAIRIDDQPG